MIGENGDRAGRRTVTKLGELIEEAVSGFACGQRVPDGVVQLRMNNVTRRGELDWSSFIRVPATKELVEDYSLRSGDVVFNNTNSAEMVGKTACFQRFDEPVVFSNHFTRLRTKPHLLVPEFLALWLHAQWQAGLFAQICDRWIGQSAVQRNKLLSLEIPVPPVEEQRRIAARLREQLSILAEARCALEAQLVAAESLRAAHLRAVCESEDIQQWPLQRLGDVLVLRQDIVHPRNKPCGPARFVGLEHIESNTGRRIGELPIEMGQMTGRKARFFTGDLIYGYLRPYLNKVWIAEFDGLCSVDQYVFEVRRNIADTDFVAWFMRSSTYLSRAPVKETPGWLPRIRTDEVAGVEINLPPVEVQRSIANRLNMEFAETEALQRAVKTKLSELEKLPATLLRSAFSPNGD